MLLQAADKGDAAPIVDVGFIGDADFATDARAKSAFAALIGRILKDGKFRRNRQAFGQDSLVW